MRPRCDTLRSSGMTDVFDVVVAAGAQVVGLSQAAAAGNFGGWLRPDTSLADRVLALAMAADHQRLNVIDVRLESPGRLPGRRRPGPPWSLSSEFRGIGRTIQAMSHD